MGDIVKKATSGGTPSTKVDAYYGGYIPWLNTKEVNFNRIWETEKTISDLGLKNSSAKWIDKNSVIVAMYGATAAKVAINKIPLTTNQACCNLIVDEIKANYEFVFYGIWNKYDELENIAVGAAQQNLSVGVITDFIISLPPLPEQTAIASILSSLDDKIDLLQRQNATLEKMAETLFRQWFVEEAKEEWEEPPLSEFATFYNGKSRPHEEGLIPIYGGNGILGYTNKSNYSGKSIIVGRVGAYCGSLYYENKGIWVSDNALLVKAKIENTTHFLFYLLKALDLNSMAEGSSHPLLTQTLLKSIKILKPPIKKIEKFDLIIEKFQDKIESNQTQIHTLTALRDTLLPKLMSGEVRVKM